jgi:hypothetical protein
MSDSFLKIRRFAVTTACIAALVVPVFAQNQSSRKTHHGANRSKQKPINVAPRSLPSSAVPQASGTKASASSQELARIERSSVSHAKPAAQQNVHAAPGASHVSNSHERSTPMNFAYQAPRGASSGATKGSRTPNSPRTH